MMESRWDSGRKRNTDGNGWHEMEWMESHFSSVFQLRFLAFEREWAKSIDFGVRCPRPEIQRLLDLLKTDYPKIIKRKAVFHKMEYALEYQKI